MRSLDPSIPFTQYFFADSWLLPFSSFSSRWSARKHSSTQQTIFTLRSIVCRRKGICFRKGSRDAMIDWSKPGWHINRIHPGRSNWLSPLMSALNGEECSVHGVKYCRGRLIICLPFSQSLYCFNKQRSCRRLPSSAVVIVFLWFVNNEVRLAERFNREKIVEEWLTSELVL